MNYTKIRAAIGIDKGKIVFGFVDDDGVPVTDENQRLLILQNILSETLFNIEKELQKKFIPNEDTVYNLPEELRNQ